MRLVVQRVTEASVSIDGILHNSIGKGLLILMGTEDSDNESDIEWLANKVANLRIFSDSSNLMNLSVQDIQGEVLIISQFTLFAQTKKGNRPSYIKASKPETAIPKYESFIQNIKSTTGLSVKSGIFGADMKVSLLNDGPVTIFIDSKNKE